jgi:hypothetical protein
MGWIATRLHRDQCERQRDPDRRSVVTSPTMRAIAHASCHTTRHMAATPQLLIADDWLNSPVEHSGGCWFEAPRAPLGTRLPACAPATVAASLRAV